MSQVFAPVVKQIERNGQKSVIELGRNIFVYSHIQTNQIVYSLRSTLKVRYRY